MAPETHALLGASSAKQWLGCPPSVRLVESLGLPDEGSEFAEQGTEAHALAELKLRLRLGEITKRQFSSRMRAHRNNPYYDQEMEEATNGYVEYVCGLAESLHEETGELPIVELEQIVDFGAYVPQGFGTADCVVISGDELHVIDLKYGKGVQVDAEDNPQLKLYALGALERYGMLYEVSSVHTAICQPRLRHYDSDSFLVEELEVWGETYVKPRARLAWDGEGDYAPGEDTCRWCRAKAVCRARADEALKAACVDFSTDPAPDAEEVGARLVQADTLTEDEVAHLLTLTPLLKAWCKDVEDHAFAKAQEGVRYEGWKLVEGRSTRKILDQDAAIEALEAAGVPAEDYLKPYELQGITALTKSLGKKRFSEILEPFVTKPAGKPVLVPESDKRPAIGSAEGAAEDFKD